MSNATHKDGIRIAFYPGRLTAEELSLIIDMATSEGIARKSPEYADWLQDFATAELERRRAEDEAEPREVEVPLFDGSKWTSGQMADALIASGVAVRMARDEDAGLALELLVQFDELIRAWAAQRLRRLAEIDR